jgi:predicted DNA-binding transcriptional regulator AlpA
MHTSKYMRSEDAAKHLGLAPSTLAKLRCSGLGPRYFKLGRIAAYTLDDLDAWAESRARLSTSEKAA